MNGISLAISKAYCPVSSFGTNNKISFGASRKIDLIPCQLPNLHLQRVSPFEATKPKLKHRVYSSSAFKDVTGTRFEVPEVTSAVVPAIGTALCKAWEVVVQLFSARGSKQGALILLGLSAVYLARGLLLDILCGFVVLRGRPFSRGDIIEVGYLKGEVWRTGVTTTSVLTDGNRLIKVPTCWFYGKVIKIESRTTTVVPYSLIFGKAIVNKQRAQWHPMFFKLHLDVEDLPKVEEISKEIISMMRSNPNVHLEEQQQPYCSLSKVDKYRKLHLGCLIKQMNEEEYIKAKHNVVLQSCLIIKKHGAAVGGYRGEEVKTL